VLTELWRRRIVPNGRCTEPNRARDEAFVKILNDPEIRTRLESLGRTVVGGSPDSAKSFMTGELLKWGPIVRASGAQVD
jgi:tripartite-type tricarboxylate transporter receptor subunit TctC